MNLLDHYMLTVVLPFVVFCSLLEAFILSRKNHYDWRAAGVSVLDLVVRISMQIFIRASIATPLIILAYRHRLQTIEFEGVGMFLALFVGQEFCYYWYHRAAHRVRWFWCNHAVHHSPNELNLSAAYRIGIFGQLSGTSLFFIPLIWFGFAPRLVFQLLTLNLLYQFWIHATWIPKLGWLEWVLNTPSAHRVHHAANLNYLDANYGGVLIIFDRLFGTYRSEQADEPCRYGLVTPLVTYNPMKVELHQWLALWKDLTSTANPWHWAQYLVRPPGWQPNGDSQTTEDLRRLALAGTQSSPSQHSIQHSI
jgi:sterol desaturase/sphingolipid hydroxylase (fatty acid hydroxylase superfamily)